MRVASLQTPVQCLTHFSDLEPVVTECLRRGVDLLLTPEFAVGGLSHTAEGAEARAATLERIIEVWAAALPKELTVVLGFTERALDGVYSSAAVLQAGSSRAVCRKVFPREPGIMPASRPPLPVDLGPTSAGILICADARHSELADGLAQAGARILLCPLNNDMSAAHADQWERPTFEALRDRARETNTYLVSADVAGSTPGRRALGATRAIAPTGETIASAADGPDSLIVVDLPV